MPSSAGQLTGSGSTRPAASNPATGPRASSTRVPVPGSTVTTCVGVTAPLRTHAMRPPTHESPPCTPRDSSRTSPLATSSTHSRPKPCSLRQNATWLPSGDHANDRCPGPHDGSPCSALLLHERTRAGAVAIGPPEVEPPVRVAEEGELRSVGREAGLLHGHAFTTRHRDRIAAAVRGANHDAALVPRHVGNVPLVPRDVGRVGRPHGVEAEVGARRDALRPWAVGRDRRDPDVVGVDHVGHARAVRRDGGRGHRAVLDETARRPTPCVDE